MNVTLKIYHKLPPSIRGIAASIHGAKLNFLRYSRLTPKLISEARERESWSFDQWQAWRQDQLSSLLRSASLHVPYYRDYWKGQAGASVVSDIQNWPILEKQVVRDYPERFVSDLSRGSKLYCTHTSGSTGSPMKIIWSAETARKWYALVEARWRNWYGVTRFNRWAIIGGKQVVPPSAQKPPYWVYNHGMNQLYMSAYHLSCDSAADYVQALKAHRIQFIHTYTSGIYSLARFITDLGISPPQLKVIVINAEPIYDHQRELIEFVFQCPVRETYGMAEMVAGAGECDTGHLHLWPDAGYMEVDAGNENVLTSGTGQLIATGLVNFDMPLIRYRVGDSVTLSEQVETCSCGRSMPVLSSVEGRNDDLLKTKDGREIGRLDTIFKSSYPILEAQIVQKTLDLCVLRLVPTPGYSDVVAVEISNELKALMGPIRVEVKLVEAIPRGANGKFRAVLCEVK